MMRGQRIVEQLSMEATPAGLGFSTPPSFAPIPAPLAPLGNCFGTPQIGLVLDWTWWRTAWPR
eukprot:4445952-Amphidinium_carterae.1